MNEMPSPKARDWRTGDKPENRHKRRQETGNFRSPDLNDVATPGGQLNPDWTEWLQGFPIGWSALEPLAIHRYPEWFASHGSY